MTIQRHILQQQILSIQFHNKILGKHILGFLTLPVFYREGSHMTLSYDFIPEIQQTMVSLGEQSENNVLLQKKLYLKIFFAF